MDIHFNPKYINKASAHWIVRRKTNQSTFARYKLMCMSGDPDAGLTAEVIDQLTREEVPVTETKSDSNMMISIGNFTTNDLENIVKYDLYLRVVIKAHKIGPTARSIIVIDTDNIILIKGSLLEQILLDNDPNDRELISMTDDKHVIARYPTSTTIL